MEIVCLKGKKGAKQKRAHDGRIQNRQDYKG